MQNANALMGYQIYENFFPIYIQELSSFIFEKKEKKELRKCKTHLVANFAHFIGGWVLWNENENENVHLALSDAPKIIQQLMKMIFVPFRSVLMI